MEVRKVINYPFQFGDFWGANGSILNLQGCNTVIEK